MIPSFLPGKKAIDRRLRGNGRHHLVKNIRERYGVTLFIIEHVMKVIMRACGRIIVIHQGEKIAEGTPRGVVGNRQVVEAYLGNVAGI